MKNRLFERNRKLQKVYAAKRHQRMTGGITVRHCYNENHDFERTWWDDSGFILNGRYIAIWLVHPRMEFSDSVDEQAHENCPSPSELDVVSKRDKEVFMDWYARLNLERARLMANSDRIIYPKIKVDNLDWCRGVSIIAPIEVHGYADLKTLCGLVKRILKGQTTISKEFPNYSYGKDDWAAEELKFKKD